MSINKEREGVDVDDNVNANANVNVKVKVKAPFKFSQSETLMLVNLQPSDLATLSALLPQKNRLTDDQYERLLGAIKEIKS